jgi:hypothetical protein
LLAFLAGVKGTFVRLPRNPAIPRRHAEAAKSTQCRTSLRLAGLDGGDSMRVIEAELKLKPVPSIVPADIPLMSDDECLRRLAKAVEEHDSEHLDEVARLIGRLAVTIE